jgi:hypothetical protein
MVLNYTKDKCNTLKTWKNEDWLHNNFTMALGGGVRFMTISYNPEGKSPGSY